MKGVLVLGQGIRDKKENFTLFNCLLPSVGLKYAKPKMSSVRKVLIRKPENYPKYQRIDFLDFAFLWPGWLYLQSKGKLGTQSAFASFVFLVFAAKMHQVARTSLRQV